MLLLFHVCTQFIRAIIVCVFMPCVNIGPYLNLFWNARNSTVFYLGHYSSILGVKHIWSDQWFPYLMLLMMSACLKLQTCWMCRTGCAITDDLIRVSNAKLGICCYVFQNGGILAEKNHSSNELCWRLSSVFDSEEVSVSVNKIR